MQTLSKFSCSLLRQAVVSSAWAIPTDLKDHSHEGGCLPLTLNLWLIVEFCHKTTSLPQAGSLPSRVTNCQANQSAGGSKSKLPFTPESSHFWVPNAAVGHTKENFRSTHSPLHLLTVCACHSEIQRQKNTYNSLSSLNQCETVQ